MTKRTNSPAIDATDEKGNLIVSSVVDETRCEWCDAKVPVHRAGRRPRFCSPAHRLAMHRAVEAYRRAVEEARRAQAAADAKVEAARAAIRRGEGDFGTGLDSHGAAKRLQSIRFMPASNETPGNPAENAAEAMTQPAWTYVKGRGWVDPATIEA